MSIDQRAGILTDMLRTIIMKEKHEKLKRDIWRFYHGEWWGLWRELKSSFLKNRLKMQCIKKKLFGIISSNANESSRDVEVMMQEEIETLNYDQDFVWADEKRNVNNMESLKDVVERFLQADKSLVTRQTTHCKKILPMEEMLWNKMRSRW